MSVDSSDREIVDFVTRELRTRLGAEASIQSMRIAPSELQSSCRIDDVRLTLSDGRTLMFILKRLDPHGWLSDARRIRPRQYYRAERELIVYRDFLSRVPLNTAAYYGCASSDADGRVLLLLEKVEGLELYQQGDLYVWCLAARWLANFHIHFASSNWADWQPCLAQYDENFYLRWLDRAEHNINCRKTNATASDVACELAGDVVAECRGTIAELLALPVTLLHGEFFPSNILVRPIAGVDGICPIDWETAAIGPGQFDLVQLTSGNWSAEDRKAIEESYVDAAIAAGAMLERPAWDNTLRLCRLHNAMRWLAWSKDWIPPAEHQNDWLGEAQRAL